MTALYTLGMDLIAIGAIGTGAVASYLLASRWADLSGVLVRLHSRARWWNDHAGAGLIATATILTFGLVALMASRFAS
jgi:hypothetical protein